MTNTNNIKIPEEIYIWAIKESKKDFEEIKLKFNNIEAWISQELFPTFRQVKELANFLKVPFGYMFLKNPPKIKEEEEMYKNITRIIYEDGTYKDIKQKSIDEHNKLIEDIHDKIEDDEYKTLIIESPYGDHLIRLDKIIDIQPINTINEIFIENENNSECYPILNYDDIVPYPKP